MYVYFVNDYFAKDEVRIHDLIQDTTRHVRREKPAPLSIYMLLLVTLRQFLYHLLLLLNLLPSHFLLHNRTYFLVSLPNSPFYSSASHSSQSSSFPSSYTLFVLTFYFPFCSSYWYISIFSRLISFFMYSIRLFFISLLPCLCLPVTVADRYL